MKVYTFGEERRLKNGDTMRKFIIKGGGIYEI
jgi:hypothetical protein